MEKSSFFGRRTSDGPAPQGLAPQLVLTLLAITAGALASYYGAQLASQKSNAELQTEISSLLQHNKEVVDPQLAANSELTGILKDGMCILLRDRGYESVKVCSVGGISAGPVLKASSQ